MYSDKEYDGLLDDVAEMKSKQLKSKTISGTSDVNGVVGIGTSVIPVHFIPTSLSINGYTSVMTNSAGQSWVMCHSYGTGAAISGNVISGTLYYFDK